MKNTPIIDSKIDHSQTQNPISLYEKRIATLKEYAKEDGFDLNEDSYANFVNFLEKYSGLARAGLVLLDNGNLRAIWQGKNDAQVGLEFLTDSSIEYVMLNESGARKTTSKPYGRGGFEETMNQIRNFGLYDIMFE